mgnify:CR=1 FL=1
MYIPYNIIYNFLINRCLRLNIDESHAIKHSMDVLKYSQKILDDEKKQPNNQDLNYNEKVIYTSAILHDMCDKKYMDQSQGLNEIKNFLKNTENTEYKENDINNIIQIMNTMSYSTVKKNGFPNLGIYQKEYHIVREADLLSGYDVERCMVYSLLNKKLNYKQAFEETKQLYEVRMGKFIEDNLFTTKFGLEEAKKLDTENRIRLNELEELLK